MSKIKTFRGLLSDGVEEKIRLTTLTGTTGYRILKFELIPPAPGVSNGENVVKIYKVTQAAVDALVDFTETTMLAAGYYAAESSSYSDNKTVVFDNEIFNQDIFITNKDARGNSQAINYYIELEQVKLDSNETSVATLKNIRNRG
jgi:hypothetical protein